MEGTGETGKAGEPRWYCLRSKTKREHVAAAHLAEAGGAAEVFCPRIRFRKATRRGKVWWVEAMFPGYFFARFALAERKRFVLATQGVTGIVHFGEEIPEVPGALVEELRRAVPEEDATLELRSQALPGDEVEIAGGPLRGQKGQVMEVLPARERVRVLIEFLGNDHPVDLDLLDLILPRRPVPAKA